MLEALSLVCDPCSGHDVLDGVMLVCDPCSGHISTENDIWMMVVMVVMPRELMEPMHLVDGALACAMHLMEPVEYLWSP